MKKQLLFILLFLPAFLTAKEIRYFVQPGEILDLYGAQNEAYMSRSAEKLVRGLCFNELGVGG